jgi:cytochrome c oxidase subunit 1
MMFALGFLWTFMIGGFTGVMHSAAPADAQQQDTYFIVAHFHYVLIGGAVFALLAGIHYWFPLVFGRKVSEFWGKLSFWIIFVGFNVAFFPMHFLGLNGMPRRTAVYDGNMGWNGANLTCTIGAFILAIGVGVYFSVMIYSYFRGEKAKGDVWDGRTLEWSVPSYPPPDYNFAATPNVHARDAFWYEKNNQAAVAAEKAARIKSDAAHGGIHMPSQSWFPLLTAVGMLIGGLFFVNHNMPGAIAGLAVVFLGAYLWAVEGPGGYHIHPEGDGHDNGSGHH